MAKKKAKATDWADFAKEIDQLKKGLHAEKAKGLSDTRIEQIKGFVAQGLFVTVTGPDGLVYQVEKGKITEYPPRGAPRPVTAEQVEATLREAITRLSGQPADEIEEGRTAAGRIAELETSLKELELLKSLGAAG
jgi:hypothetical protein